MSAKYPAVPESPASKIALFQSLFRGREDVHARRFDNPKSGKSGYTPACGNEWLRGVASFSHFSFTENLELRPHDRTKQAMLDCRKSLWLSSRAGHSAGS